MLVRRLPRPNRARYDAGARAYLANIALTGRAGLSVSLHGPEWPLLEPMLTAFHEVGLVALTRTNGFCVARITNSGRAFLRERAETPC